VAAKGLHKISYVLIH